MEEKFLIVIFPASINHWNKINKMIKCNLKIKPKLSMSSVNWFLQRIRMNLSWLLLPFLVLYSFVYPIITKDYLLIVLAIFSYLFMQAFTYFTTLFIIEKIERKRVDKKIINFGAVCLSTLISNMGPIYSLFNVKMKKYKTVR